MKKGDSLRSGSSATLEPSLKLNLLSKLDIFRDLSDDEIQQIEEMVKMITCKRGHVFFRPDEKAEVLFMLKKGKVQVYTISSEGKRLIVETIGPGTFFGEMSLTAQSMHESFAEAVEDSLICVLSRADIEMLLLQKPQVAIRLLDAMSHRLQETRFRLEETALHNATVRVCRALFRLSQGTTRLEMTHQELADSTGLFRETVTNILNELQSQGLVELSRKKIVILNRSELQGVKEI